MKKILFATTALAAVSLASGSIAQESAMMTPAGNTLNIGGYYEFGWTSLSDDYEGADDGGDAFTYGDSELYIDFENTADNGLTYGVEIDLEIVDGSKHTGVDKGSTENTDQANLFVKGDFGTVKLGHIDPAYGTFQMWAPTHEGTFSQDDQIPWRGDLGSQFIDNVGNGDGIRSYNRPSTALWHSPAGLGQAYDDSAKVVYISPSFNGFSFGASMRDTDDTADNNNSFGLQYSGDIGPGSLTVVGSTETNNADGGDKVSHTHYGVSYGMGAFTVTASRAKGKQGTGAGGGDIEREATEFGVGFQVSDQLSVGASTASSTAEQASSMLDQEGTFQSVSGSYTIAPGLKTTIALNQFSVENNGAPAFVAETGTRNVTAAQNKNDGSIITWQVEFAF